jgi:hypothetical protein
MDQQMESYICCNAFLNVFQSAAKLRVTENIQLSMNYLVCSGMLVKSYLGGRLEFHRYLFLVRSCLYHILTTSRGLSGIAIFTFMQMICKFITLMLRRTFRGVLMS